MGKLVVYLKYFFIVFLVIIQTIVFKALSFVFPDTTKKIILKLGEKTTMTQNPKFKFEDWGPTFWTLNFVKEAVVHAWKNTGDEAFVGGLAPNTPVLNLDGEKTDIYGFIKDGWSFRNNVEIKCHTSLQDRQAAAQVLLKEDPPCPVVLDTMADEAASKYGAMPERLYVLQSKEIIYKVI
ncbi:UNVERIFIED_CONTAM: hypothetical protein FKN15_009137 [Acipenser sinensis]